MIENKRQYGRISPPDSSVRTSEIWLADLWHQEQMNRYFPLGIAYVAAYSQKIFGERFSFRLFTNPDLFIRHCHEGKPLVVGMRNDLSRSRLSYELIVRLKRLHPDTVSVMGGPNYPLEPDKQIEYLKARTMLDFYIVKDGEIPFAALLKHLNEFEFDVAALKRSLIEIPGVHYLRKDLSAANLLIAGNMPARPRLDDFPSPYLAGLLDPFFKEGMIPVIQTTRGCPFPCAYCAEGEGYFNRIRSSSLERQKSVRLKIRRFSLEYLKSELDCIADRPDKIDLLFLADSNFGMYKEDIETAELIGEMQKTRGWPGRLAFNVGKNKKKSVLDALHRFLPGTALYSASVQSTDPIIMENVRRKTVSVPEMIEISMEAEKYGSFSFTELILGMPGETVSSYLKTLRTVIEAGIRILLIYPLHILAGSEMDTAEYRRRFQIVPHFSLVRKSTGQYLFGEESLSITEISEIGTVHSTMSLDDYLECRTIGLSVALFYNHGCFSEAESLLKHLNLSVFDFIERCHRLASDIDSGGELSRFYSDIRAYDRKIMFQSFEQAEKFAADPENMKEYTETEYKFYFETIYRVGMILYAEQMHHIARQAITGQLKDNLMLTEDLGAYIAELFRFSLYRKKDPLNTELVFEDEFRFDFVELLRLNFQTDPMKFLRKKKQRLRFAHSPQTAAEIRETYRFLTDIKDIMHQRWTSKSLIAFFREAEILE